MIATTAATAPEMRRHARSVSAALFVVTSCWELSHAGPPLPADSTARPDAYVTRLEAALLLQTLNADLLSHDSATLTLERWCAAHQLASPTHVTAERVRDAEKSPTADQRQRLHAASTEEIRYRRVKLRCGSVVLSEADNWYVPARLTPEMNRLLDTTDTPFGRAVQPLHFERHTISVQVLADFLPLDWEMQSPSSAAGTGTTCLPTQVLQHRALLTLPDGTPISEVVETYNRNLLALPRLASLPRCE
jgi:chorismate-pyruvate lyase